MNFVINVGYIVKLCQNQGVVLSGYSILVYPIFCVRRTTLFFGGKDAKMKNDVHNYLNPDLVETGEKIRALRESRGMSQEQLAELVGVSKNSISRYETGTADMKSSVLFEISKVLDTTPNELASDKYCFHNEIAVNLTDIIEGLGEEKQRIIYLTIKSLAEAL